LRSDLMREYSLSAASCQVPPKSTINFLVAVRTLGQLMRYYMTSEDARRFKTSFVDRRQVSKSIVRAGKKPALPGSVKILRVAVFGQIFFHVLLS
jgi:hypothetical protein